MADLPGDRPAPGMTPANSGGSQPKTRVAPVRPGNSLSTAEDVQKLVAVELTRWLTDLNPLWLEWDNMWAKWQIQPVDPNTNPFLAKIQVPYGNHAVEVILPRILGENPTMNYRAIDDDSDNLVAMLAGKVATYQMQRMGFEYEARDFIRQALVANYTVAKVGWKRTVGYEQTETVELHPAVQDQPELGHLRVRVPGTQQVTLKNEPFFAAVNVKDFVWPLTAASLDDATAVWQRVFKPLAYVQELGRRGVYKNVDQVTAQDGGYWNDAYQNQYAAQGLSPSAPTADNVDPENGLVELWERWEDDRVTVIANRTVCLRDEPSPFWHKRKPFVDFTPIPRPFQLQGLGIMRMVHDSNEHLNTMMRQMADAVTYTLNPAFKTTEGVDWDNFILQPGAHLSMPDMEDVLPLVTPQVDLGGAVQLRQLLIEDMQRTSGAFEYIGGAFPTTGGTHTATGVATVIQEGTKRISEMTSVFAYRTMRRFGYLLLSMNAQWLDQDILVDLSDDPKAQEAWQEFAQAEMPASGMVKITPQMLSAKGRLEPIPQVGQDKTLSETQKRSDATQALQAVAPILASPQNPLNMSAIADWALKQMGMPEEERAKVMQTPPVQQAAALNDATSNSNGASGPSGEPLPTGGVVGAPGVAGGSGPPGLSQR